MMCAFSLRKKREDMLVVQEHSETVSHFRRWRITLDETLYGKKFHLNSSGGLFKVYGTTISKSSTNLLEFGYENKLVPLSLRSYYCSYLHNRHEVWSESRADK